MTPRRHDRIPEVKTVMTPFPWFVEMDDPLEAAKALMSEHGIRHLPVTEDGRLAGALADRDIRSAENAAAGPARKRALRVRDACERDAYVVDLHTPLDRVLAEMARRHVDAALVVRNEKLAGIFTATDACRAFAGFLESMFPRGGGDEVA